MNRENPGRESGSRDDLIHGWAGICADIGKSRAQLWRDVRAGLFPAPIETGPNSLAWRRSEIEAWKASRPRRTYGRTDETQPAAA